jgi:hypothetical protein
MIRVFFYLYCPQAFLDAIVTLDFSTIESLWREFWRSQDNNNGDECEEEKYLSKSKLFCLSKCVPVQAFVRRVDFLFYQNLVEVLIPDVLRPIPGRFENHSTLFCTKHIPWNLGMYQIHNTLVRLRE